MKSTKIQEFDLDPNCGFAKETTAQEILGAVGNVAQQEDLQEILGKLNAGENATYKGGQVNVIGCTASYTEAKTYGKFVFDEPYDEIPIVTAVDIQGSYRGEDVLTLTKVNNTTYNVVFDNFGTLKTVATITVALDGVTIETTAQSTSSSMQRFGLTMVFSPRLK